MTIEMRWGIPELDQEIAMTRIPNFILEYAAELTVTPQELAMIIHLAAFRYESPKGVSKPSIMTIATLLGYTDDKQVRRMIRRLEDAKLLQVTRTTGQTSIYDFKGLSQKCLDMFRERGLPSKGVGGLPSRGGVGLPSKGVEEGKVKERKEKKLFAPVGPDGDPQTEPANPLSSEEDLDAPKPTHSAAPRTPSDHQRRTEIIARELALDGNLDWELLDQSTRQGFFTRAAALWKRELKPIHELKAITPEELARFAAGRVDKKKRLNFPTRDGVLAGAFSHWRGLDTLQQEKPVKKRRMQTVFDENDNPIGGQEVD